MGTHVLQLEFPRGPFILRFLCQEVDGDVTVGDRRGVDWPVVLTQYLDEGMFVRDVPYCIRSQPPPSILLVPILMKSFSLPPPRCEAISSRSFPPLATLQCPYNLLRALCWLWKLTGPDLGGVWPFFIASTEGHAQLPLFALGQPCPCTAQRRAFFVPALLRVSDQEELNQTRNSGAQRLPAAPPLR